MPWGWDYSGSSNLEELQYVLEEHVMIRYVMCCWLNMDVEKQTLGASLSFE